MCDFCRERESISVYAVDHGPFSLAYCDECLKHPNIRTVFNALSKFIRLGYVVFDEYKDLNGAEPNVYYNGRYISLRELVEIIDVAGVEKYVPKNSFLYPILIDKLNSETTLTPLVGDDGKPLNFPFRPL